MATFMVPLDFTAAGTVAAMAALVDWVGMVAVGRATDVVVVAGAAVVDDVLELLEHAAARTVTAPMLAATATFRKPRSKVNTIRPPLLSTGRGPSVTRIRPVVSNRRQRRRQAVATGGCPAWGGAHIGAAALPSGDRSADMVTRCLVQVHCRGT